MSTLTVIDGGKTDSSAPAQKNWSQVRKRAKELTEELELGYMELARILYEVHDTPMDNNPQKGPIYVGWGYKNFEDYAEQELQLNKKKAERLRLIFYVLEVQLKTLSPEIKQRIVNLGLSKVRELIRVLTMRNAEHWLNLAESTTYRGVMKAVTDELRQRKVESAILGTGVENAREIAEEACNSDSPLPVIPSDGYEDEKVSPKSFGLTPTQHANVLLALKKSSEISGSDKHGYNMDLICTDFLMTNDVIGTDEDEIERKAHYVSKIERTLKLKLIAVDPDTGEVVHGYTALEDLYKKSKETN